MQLLDLPSFVQFGAKYAFAAESQPRWFDRIG
jgi:hypothetical protein